MARKVYHVTYSKTNGNWKVKPAGTQFPISTFNLKDEAVKLAVTLAKAEKPSQVKIHGRDGKIQNEWTYKHDPKRYLS